MEDHLEHIESHVQETYDYQLDSAFIVDKLMDLEDRSRRNSLRVNSMKERPNKTLGDCEKELDALFKESLDIDEEVVIERPNRVKTVRNKKGNTPKKVVCKIINYKDKVKILRNSRKLKGKNIFINENFS